MALLRKRQRSIPSRARNGLLNTIPMLIEQIELVLFLRQIKYLYVVTPRV
jgi:hypothetical protein